MGRRIKNVIGYLITLTVVAIAGLILYEMFQDYLLNPWTRDGQVQGQIIQITSRVSGPIVTIPIVDNQFVNKGDLLFKIDPRTFAAEVAEAKASLAQAKAAAAEAKDKAQRGRDLYKKDQGAVSELSLVEKVNELRQAEAAVQVAQADLHSAELDLEFTEVRAPLEGYVTNLNLQIGSHTVENQPALALVDISSYYVYGFFKETQIENIKPGDKAVVKLMSYPDKPLDGLVDSIGWGIAQQDGTTGADLLPSINPSFDWIRLAQRIPVRVHLTRVPEGVTLRLGTTATVIVLNEQ
jgi:RND family efflux transporter MFP subunit